MKASSFHCVSGASWASGHYTVQYADTVLLADTGVFATFRRDDGLDISLPVITGVDISGMPAVVDYKITQQAATTMHSLQFEDGGRLQLTYDADGKVTSVTSEQVRVTASESGRIALTPWPQS